MATSQNGWPVDRSGELQDRSPVRGAAFPNGVRRGDVATVLFYVADRFHREVEPLRPGWCWGWYVKGIEGSNSVSNHASGTAIDLNAPDHPLGSRGTFTTRQVAAIRRILDACDGVVRWGGDYRTRADEMHFEIVKGAAAVAALAKQLRTQEDDVTPEDRKAIIDGVIGALVVSRDNTSWKSRYADSKGNAPDPTLGTAVAFAAYDARDAEVLAAAARDAALRTEQLAATRLGEIDGRIGQIEQFLTRLGSPAATPQQTADLIRAILGDRAAEVGRILAGATTRA